MFCHWQCGYFSFPHSYNLICILSVASNGAHHLLMVMSTELRVRYNTKWDEEHYKIMWQKLCQIHSGWHGSQTTDKVKIWPRNDHPVNSDLITKVFKKLEMCHLVLFHTYKHIWTSHRASQIHLGPNRENLTRIQAWAAWNISINNRPHEQQWSHKIVVKLQYSYASWHVAEKHIPHVFVVMLAGVNKSTELPIV